MRASSSTVASDKELKTKKAIHPAGRVCQEGPSLVLSCRKVVFIDLPHRLEADSQDMMDSLVWSVTVSGSMKTSNSRTTKYVANNCCSNVV